MLTTQKFDTDTTITEFASLNHLQLADVNLVLAISDPKVRFTGVISGPGGITKTGTGSVQLAGMNTFQGPITVEEGELVLSGVNLGNVTVNSGTLKFVARNTLSAKSSITIEKDGAVDLQGQELEVTSLNGSGQITVGFGNLILHGGNFTGLVGGGRKSTITKQGTGRCVLSQCRDISLFLVLKGELVGSTHTFMGNINVASTLVFEQDDDGDFTGQMMGIGTVIKRGGGGIRITKAGMRAPKLQIEAGSIEIQQSWDGAIEVGEKGVLVIGRTQSLTGLSGAGIVELKDNCTLTIPQGASFNGEFRGEGIVRNQQQTLYDSTPKLQPMIFSGKPSLPPRVEISNTYLCARPQQIVSEREMVLTQTGVLDLAGHSQQFKHLSGEGVVRLANAVLTLETCDFKGQFEGSGTLVVGEEECQYKEGNLVGKKAKVVL